MAAAGLEGQVALVTGAAHRIGRAVALELARAGAHLALHVHRSGAAGDELAHAVEALGVRAAVVEADQRDVAAIERACRQAADALGPVTRLVNSAALWPKVALADLTQEDWDLAQEVDLRGPFFWARLLGVEMQRRGEGAIVSIADVSHDRPTVDALPYCIAKAGVVAMTYGLAKALAPQVRVCAIAPGPIVFPADYPAQAAAADRRATLRGCEGEPDDIARAVRFLFESPNVTGVCLPVDGGYRFGI